MLVAGLRFPVATAILGGVWAGNRVVYALGYARTGRQGGKGRYYGIAWQLAHFALIGMAAVTAVGLVRT